MTGQKLYPGAELRGIFRLKQSLPEIRGRDVTAYRGIGETATFNFGINEDGEEA
jgi:hypothetical protein